MKKRHLIVGELILDRFLYGKTERISAEAPTLVMDVDYKVDSFGGAYNVAAHLCSLGDECHFVTVVGPDYDDLKSRFNDDFHPKCTQKLFIDKNRRTSIKTRLISTYKHTHLLRYDSETTADIDQDTKRE